jgi:hypothetical protein
VDQDTDANAMISVPCLEGVWLWIREIIKTGIAEKETNQMFFLVEQTLNNV